MKQLRLSGDIQMPMVEHLQMHMLRGPFSIQVIESFKKYHALAEGEYGKGYYDAARWRWNTLGIYWRYLWVLRSYHLEGRRMVRHGRVTWLSANVPAQRNM
jgi:hypothetical protein